MKACLVIVAFMGCGFLNVGAQGPRPPRPPQPPIAGRCNVSDMYTLIIEEKWMDKTQSPDGVPRMVMTINGEIPGPEICVNQGQILTIRVENHLKTEGVSMHWHGLLQERSEWFDGVEGVSQFPIMPSTHMTYVMPIGDQFGTYWAHSHMGMQYMDGIYSALTILPRNPRPIIDSVTAEYTVLFSEWYHDTSTSFLTQLFAGVIFAPPFTTALIDGAGIFDCTQAPDPNNCEQRDWEDLTSFSVQEGHKYRFRVSSGTAGGAYSFSIDNHKLTIVATDGVDTMPYQVDAINIYSAERYDVIVTMNQPSSKYWMRIRQLDTSDVISTTREGLAFLNYDGTPPATPPTSTYSDPVLRLTNSLALAPWINEPIPPMADETHTFTVGCSGTTCTVNDIVYEKPPSPIIVYVTGQLPLPSPNVNVVWLSSMDVIRVVVNNNLAAYHPMHMHGHLFWWLGAGEPNAGPFDPVVHGHQLNLNNPVRKDVVPVAPNSWVVWQFVADNPGVWFAHCHIEWHMVKGMEWAFIEAPNLIRQAPLNFPVTTPYMGGPVPPLTNAEIRNYTLAKQLLKDGKRVVRFGARNINDAHHLGYNISQDNY